MPIPKPTASENKKQFIIRCMADPVMVKEYKNKDQRLAICSTQFENK